MKKYFLFVFGIIFAVTFISFAPETVGYEEKTIHRVVEKKRKLVCGSAEKPIRVAGLMNYPPFGWKEIFERKLDAIPMAVYHGVGVELFKRFAEENDFRYQFVNALNSDEAKFALTNGYLNILLGDYYNQNSFSTIKHFYPGYVSNPIVIVVLKPQNDTEKLPETWEDLKGKKGVMRTEENIFELLYKQIPPDVQIEKVEGAKRAFQLLLRKQADFMITSQFAYETEVRRFKVGDLLAYAPTPLMSPVIFMSYQEGDPCIETIKEKLEDTLKRYASDKDLMRSILSAQIIEWERKFMKDKSLMYELEEPVVTNEEKEEIRN